MSGQQWRLAEKKRVCRVAPAHVQGLAANLAQYVHSSDKLWLEPPHAPMVFDEGRLVNLAAAVHLHCGASVCRELHLKCAWERPIEAAKIPEVSSGTQASVPDWCPAKICEDVDSVSTAASSGSEWPETSHRQGQVDEAEQGGYETPNPPWPHSLAPLPCAALNSDTTCPRFAYAVDGDLLKLLSEFEW
jgi:hypothetical protein